MMAKHLLPYCSCVPKRGVVQYIYHSTVKLEAVRASETLIYSYTYVLCTYFCIHTTLHDVTIQKTVIFNVIAIKTQKRVTLQWTGQCERQAGIATVANSGETGPHYSMHDPSAGGIFVPAVRPRVCSIAGPVCVSRRHPGARPLPIVCRSQLPYYSQPGRLW